jgi:tetratricopeptide (TPR) repeat protein
MAEQLRVFVSHSHKDNKFCHQIVQALRDAGADVWYDEHNLGWGVLKDEIIRELGTRPVFVLILSKAVFASKWVKRETDWAEELTDRDPKRVILPVTAGLIERDDFGTENGWLFLHGYKRIEAPSYKPYPAADAANRLLRTLALTPAGAAPAPVAPQPSEDMNDLLTRGKALIAQKQYAEALPLFERATQLAPGSFGAWANLGYVFGELNRWQEALTAFDRALALNDRNAAVWNNKGNALNELQRYAEALVALDRALALNPNLAQAWNNKGNALDELGRDEEALAAYDRALALDPKNAGTWYNKGNALYDLKRYAEALVAYERGFDPNDWRDWSARANVLRALGRTAEAEAAEKRAKELGWTG